MIDQPNPVASATRPIDTSPAWRTRLLRVSEAADYLAVSRSKLYRLINADEIQTVTTGGSRRVSLGALVDYVEQLDESAP